MTNTAAPATAAKIRAAVWTRTDKTSWNVDYNGYSFAGIKTDGTWSLIVWNEIADDWADAYVTAETALRPFWNAVTAWLPASDYVTPNPLEGYSVTAGDVDVDVAEATASIIAEHAAAAAIQLAEAEGSDAAATAVLDEIDAANACPKCGMTGTAKCVTKSGKVVKENGGRHAVRPV